MMQALALGDVGAAGHHTVVEQLLPVESPYQHHQHGAVELATCGRTGALPVRPDNHLAHAALADLQRDEGRKSHRAPRPCAAASWPRPIAVSVSYRHLHFRQFCADAARLQFLDEIYPAGIAPEDLQPIVADQYELDQQLYQAQWAYRQTANLGLQGLRFAVTVPGAGAADTPGGGVQWIRAEQAAQLGARCS